MSSRAKVHFAYQYIEAHTIGWSSETNTLCQRDTAISLVLSRRLLISEKLVSSGATTLHMPPELVWSFSYQLFLVDPNLDTITICTFLSVELLTRSFTSCPCRTRAVRIPRAITRGIVAHGCGMIECHKTELSFRM